MKNVWRCVAHERKEKQQFGLQTADCGVFLPGRFGCYDDPTVIILLGCALMPSTNRLRDGLAHTAHRWDEANGEATERFKRVRAPLPCRFGRRGWKRLFRKQTACRRFVAGAPWWSCGTRPSEEQKKREERNVHLLKRKLFVVKSQMCDVALFFPL